MEAIDGSWSSDTILRCKKRRTTQREKDNQFVHHYYYYYYFGLTQNSEEHNIYIEGKNFLEPSTGCVTSTSQVWRLVIGECVWCD